MSLRKDANLRKLAIMALKKTGLSLADLSVEEIQALKLPLTITRTLVDIKKDTPDLTVDQAKADCVAIRDEVTASPVIDLGAYDPKQEMKEFVAPYVEIKEVISEEPTITLIQEEKVPATVPYSEDELRLVFAELTSKNANTLLKLAMADLDAASVDQVLAVKLSKEFAAINKAAK